MKSTLIKISSLTGVIALFTMTLTAAAQVTDAPDLQLTVGSFIGNGSILCTFVSYFFWFVITISVIMIMYAAYVYVTAGDNAEKTARGRKYITYAAVGIAVAIIANSLPQIVGSLFANTGGGAGITGGCSTFNG